MGDNHFQAELMGVITFFKGTYLLFPALTIFIRAFYIPTCRVNPLRFPLLLQFFFGISFCPVPPLTRFHPLGFLPWHVVYCIVVLEFQLIPQSLFILAKHFHLGFRGCLNVANLCWRIDVFLLTPQIWLRFSSVLTCKSLLGDCVNLRFKFKS